MGAGSTIVSILIAALAVYVLFGLFLFFTQKSMLYYPNKQDFNSCPGFSEYEKKEHSGTRFYFKHGSNDRIIIFYHGNAGSACDRSHLREYFEPTNASLAFVEYAGYSNGPATPSQARILQDVRNMHEFARENQFKEIAVYGESLGTGAASYYSSLGGVSHLILITPFSSMDRVAQSKYRIYPASVLLREKYDNMRWLQKYNGSLVIFHGDRDYVIPQKFSRELFDKVPNGNKAYVQIEGFGHNDIWSSHFFQDKLKEYLSSSLI